MIKMRKFSLLSVVVFAFFASNDLQGKPLIIDKQGSFFVGGKSIKIKGKYDSKRW